MFIPIVRQTVQRGAIPSLSILIAQFDQWLSEVRSKKPKRHFARALHFTLCQVVLNLLVAQRGPSDLRLSVPGNKDWYRRNGAVLGPLITNASVRLVVTFLRQRGYVTWWKGTASKSKSFWSPNSVRPTERLLRLLGVQVMLPHHIIRPDELAAPIRIKSAKSEMDMPTYLPVPDDEETRRMEENLRTINRALRNHWPDLDAGYGTEAEVVQHMTARDGYDRHIDYGKRTLYRVFNNGSFTDGGRFYGGWWQEIPKRYRPFITIDGEGTVEVDYSAMHPTVLFAELGLQKPNDPYEIGIGTRDVVKRTFNALINAKGMSIGPVEGFSESIFGMPWAEFLAQVKSRFAAFRVYFGSGYGLKLQRLDSDIAEAVLLHFARKDVAVLPIHDSFIVQSRYASELIEVMEREFNKRVGGAATVKVIALSPEERRERDAHKRVCLGQVRRNRLTLSSLEGCAHLKRLSDFKSGRRSGQWTHRRRQHPPNNGESIPLTQARQALFQRPR